MSSEVKKTAKHAAIYAVGVVLERIASFVMLPIYTSKLVPADYGTLELLVMTTDLFGMIAGVGITMAVIRFYYKYNDSQTRKSLISTTFFMLIVLFGSFSTLGIVLSEPLGENVLDGGPLSAKYFRIIFIAFFLQVFIKVPFVLLKTQQKSIFFVAISTAKLVLQLGLNIWFVVFLEWGVLGVLYSTVITFSVFGLFLAVHTFMECGFNFSKKLSVELIVYGAPFIVSNLGHFALSFSDRYFLKIFAGLNEVGIYALGYKIGFVLWAMAAMPFNSIWDPKRFEIAEQSDAGRLNYRVFMLFNLPLVCLGLGLSMFSLDLFRVIANPSYYEAYKVVPFIVSAYVILAWTNFCNFGLHYAEKTRQIANANLLAAVAVLLLHVALIPHLQLYGAALATVAAFLLRFGYIYWKAQGYYRLNLPWAKVLLMCAAAVVCYVLSLLFRQENLVLSIVVNTGLYLSFLVGIWYLPVLDANDKQMIVKLVKHPIASLRAS